MHRLPLKVIRSALAVGAVLLLGPSCGSLFCSPPPCHITEVSVAVTSASGSGAMKGVQATLTRADVTRSCEIYSDKDTWTRCGVGESGKYSLMVSAPGSNQRRSS